MFDGTCLSPAYKTESAYNMREQIIKYYNLSGGVLCVILYELLYIDNDDCTLYICMPFIIVCDHRTVVKTRRTPMYKKKKYISQKSKPETGRKLVVTAATEAMSWLSYYYCGVV